MTIKTFEIYGSPIGIGRKIDGEVKAWIRGNKPITIISTSMAIVNSQNLIGNDVVAIYTIIYEYK